MSLFKPSNLTPNFESVVYNQPLTLTFQVNSNGSKVTAYRVQILKDINDDSDLEENIIGTIYGTFNMPLYNKDIGEILLTQETLSYNGINLEPNKDYRWRLRLYGEDSRVSYEKTFSVPYTMSIDQRLNAIDFSKDFTIKANNYSINKPDYTINLFLIISQEDLGGTLQNIKTSMGFESDSEEIFWNLLKKNCPKSFYLSASDIYNNVDHKCPYSFFKNKVHPYMFFYPIGISHYDKDNPKKIKIYYPSDTNIQIYDQNNKNLKYTFEVEYYQTNYQEDHNEDLTYMGNGMLVGSTKQIMWTSSYNEDMKRNSYARLVWCSGMYTDFQPFEFESESVLLMACDSKYAVIEKNAIKQKYLDNILNGNYYLFLSINKAPFSSKEYNIIENDGSLDITVLKQLRKIVSVENYSSNQIKLKIADNETILDYQDYNYLALVYIQQEKIIQVDKGIGKNYLTKITFEEPFDFNPMDTQRIHLGYVSDDFDYDRFYITPVEEFDNSDGFSYIYLFKDESSLLGNTLTEKNFNKIFSPTKIDETKRMYKIINYVSSTGEVTVYNKAKNLPTIQTYYQVYKRVATTEGTYEYKLIAGVDLLGGKESSSVPLVCNNNESVGSSATTVFFDELFIQPNISIKEDYYMPMKLEIYNKYAKQYVYLTNFYNWIVTQIGDVDECYYDTEIIDYLDDTMWRVVSKNINSKESTLIDNLSKDESLYFPQTQYKIYSNFVDCIPEGFFYSRYDKSIKFEIYDLNTMDSKTEQKVYIVKNGKIYLNDEEKDSIPFRDLYIKTICQDSYRDSNGDLIELNTNNVPLKEYHYEIMTEDGTVIYSTKETYDGKFYCEFRGCNKDSVYYIKVYVEDNFGKLYTYQVKVPIKYYELSDRTNITITPLCEKQAVKINFTPIKKVDGIGNISLDTNAVSINDTMGLTYKKCDNNKNIIELPQNFSYLTQFKLNPEILYTKRRVLLNKIVNDNLKGEIGDTYYLYLDTKPYLYKDNIYSLNPTYMKFIVTVNQELSAEEVVLDNGQTIFIRDFTNVLLTIPTQFAFVVSKEKITDNSGTIKDNYKKYIYVIPDNKSDISTEVDPNDSTKTQQERFWETVPDSCKNESTGDLFIYNEDGVLGNSDDVFLVANTESYIEENKKALQDMNTQTFKIIKTDKILEININ